MAETILAFANSDGGTLVLGISGSGELGQIFAEDEVESALQSALSQCRPPVHTEWQHEQLRGHSIVALSVPRSGEVHTTADGRVLVRKGSQNRPIEQSDIDKLMSARPASEFELQSVPGSSREDFDETVIDSYIEQRQKRNPRHAVMSKNRLLQQIGAMTVDEIPTVNGLLLFGREPQLFLPQARATFVKFADVQPRKSDGGFGYGRREELIGPLPDIIERANRIIWEEMDKKASVTTVGSNALRRREVTEYPTLAIREALVNAVAHRDYRITGRGIEIRMYSDRLEITSPGGLPAHITIDNIVEEHYSRNPRIVNGLYQWGYIEELGLGVDMMIEDMINSGHLPPEFDAKGHRFTVIFYNSKDSAQMLMQWEQNMNERQIKAAEYVQRHNSITNREYRDLCPHVGAETLRLDLADLVKKGVLLRIGEKRGTRYILKSG